MNNNSLSLESQFEVQRLKLHLQKHPEQAEELAINHFADYLELVHQYKKLQEQKRTISLPPIPSPAYARLETKHKQLQAKYMKLLMDNAQLQQQRQGLIELVDTLTDDNSPIPTFLKRILKR